MLAGSTAMRIRMEVWLVIYSSPGKLSVPAEWASILQP